MIEELKSIGTEISRSRDLPPYEAVDVAWVALVKAANLLAGKSEGKRMFALVARLPEAGMRAILQREAVNALINLDPPLESVLTSPHEELDQKLTAEQLEIVRSKRDTHPKEALENLGLVLKRVRNRRAHGFTDARWAAR